ncbi:MAG: hypothetical protein OWQ48_02685 [Desulfurococcus sp.]|nr:hypothetical protein [Desulfurococcus sp.]
MYGYSGRILRVDLSRQKAVVEELREDLVKRFVGGRGVWSKNPVG